MSMADDFVNALGIVFFENISENGSADRFSCVENSSFNRGLRFGVPPPPQQTATEPTPPFRPNRSGQIVKATGPTISGGL